MNAKGYQVLIDSDFKDVYLFTKKTAITAAERFNPSAIKAIENLFSENPKNVLNSIDLSHILAANCKRCKLPKKERIKETKRELNEYWNISPRF